MAFSHTINRTDFAGKKYVCGSYTNTGGSTGGDIVTGMNTVENLILQPLGAAVATDQSVVNETLTNGVFVGGSLTIVTPADQLGFWSAIGQ